MRKPRITIRQMRCKKEIPAISDLLGKSFNAGYQTMSEQAARAHSTSPYFAPKYTRLAEMNGEIVGHVRIQPNVFRLGEARLWVAGVGDVTTDFRHRKKGIAAAVMNDAIAFMEEEGFDLSILFGIPDFYHRFGFVPVMSPPPLVSVSIEAAEGLKQVHTCRPFRPEDISELNAFKRKHDALNTLTVCRTPAHWRYRLSRWAGAMLFRDKKKRLVGYAHMAGESERVLVSEVVAVRDKTVCESILREAAHRARAQVVKRVEFQLPPDHPLTEYCIRLGCRVTTTYHQNADGLGRIIHLKGLMQKMAPEWNRLLSRSELFGRDSSLTISTGGDRMMLRTAGGRIHLVENPKPSKSELCISRERLLQGIAGYIGPGALLDQLKDASSRRMAEVIFPNRHPFLWRMDGF